MTEHNICSEVYWHVNCNHTGVVYDRLIPQKQFNAF